MIKEFQRVYKAKDENIEYEKQLNAELNKLRKSREKYMDMYTDDLISREELNEKIGGMRKEIERLENELKMVSYHLTKGEQLEAILNSTFKQLEDITDVHEMTNAQLKRLINKIEVDKDGNVDIYLRLIGDLGLDETVLIEGDKNTEEKELKRFQIVTTIHKDVTERLVQVNPSLAAEARKVLDVNKSERHIRGGLATREKYLHQHA